MTRRKLWEEGSQWDNETKAPLPPLKKIEKTSCINKSNSYSSNNYILSYKYTFHPAALLSTHFKFSERHMEKNKW